MRPERMRAAVYRGIDTICVEDVTVPAPGPREVLVRVAACGVCGTDLKKIHYGLVPPPRIFGHETAGTIAALGAEVEGWTVGERVVVNHHVPCQSPDCFFCRRGAFAQCPVYKQTGTTAGFEPAGGGFAEYVLVREWCVRGGMVRVPDDVTFEEASFLEPLNTCLKAVRMANVQEGDTVWILGQGPIGLLFTQLAREAGARTIVTDRFAYRLDVARQLGATVALEPDSGDVEAAIRALSEGRGADLAIVAVPDTRVVASAFAAVRPAGKVLLFAHTRLGDPLEVDAGAICMEEKSLIGSYSSDITLQDEAADLLFRRRVDARPLITHRFDLESIHAAIDLATHPRENSLKVLVLPSPADR
ncbi:MAG TPA: alcohol dehydrogenase catalytic domain-containing protein [Chthonomonadaceae bacterium]|nr:alcohol dehydrogenase catalytic domain-containing protein [Chthonomonadaceae bacterium]